jgi:hypothetical protein
MPIGASNESAQNTSWRHVAGSVDEDEVKGRRGRGLSADTLRNAFAETRS